MPAIYPARSLWVGVVASCFYAAAVLAICLAALPLPIQILLMCWLAFDYRRVLRIYALGTHQYALVCMQLDCGKWYYQLRNGRCYKGQLCKEGSFCSRWLIILHMSHINGTRTLIIPRDSISTHNYRFLAFKLNCL